MPLIFSDFKLFYKWKIVNIIIIKISLNYIPNIGIYEIIYINYINIIYIYDINIILSN